MPNSKVVLLFLTAFTLISFQLNDAESIADPSSYLKDIKSELKKEWPGNRTINLVFHGHSVPAGYFKTPLVNTFDSYPFLLLKELKELYPYAVINVICTAIGGENSSEGVKRFESDVLVHKPDVLFIDYALNDRGIGLEKSKDAWEEMINKALREWISFKQIMNWNNMLNRSRIWHNITESGLRIVMINLKTGCKKVTAFPSICPR